MATIPAYGQPYAPSPYAPAAPAAPVPPARSQPPQTGSGVKTIIDTRHSDTIHDIQLDYYGRRIATASSDRTVKVHGVNGRLLATLEAHEGPVWQARWANGENDDLLATASYDGRVIVWRAGEPWRQQYEYSWHASSVNSVEFAPSDYDILALACASSDGFVSVCVQQSDGTWDERRISQSNDGASHTHPLGALSISWFPATVPNSLFDFQQAKKKPTLTIATAGCDHTVKIWSFDQKSDQWKLNKSLRGHKDIVRSVAVAPNIGLPRSVVASGGQDKKVCIWSKEIQEGATEWIMSELPTFNAPVWAVSWSTTGSILAVTSGDDGVSLWKEDLDGKWKNVTNVSGKATE